MGELSKSSTFTMLLYSSSLPLLLSPLCECLVDPPSKIFVSRRSTFQFQLFTLANSGTGIEQTTDFSQIWKKLLASRPRVPRVCHVRDENLLDYFQSIRNASNTGFHSPGYRFCTASPRSASAEGRVEGWRQDATPSLSRDPITDLLFALYSSLNEN